VGRSYYSANRSMDKRVRRIEERVRQIREREQRKVQELTIPVDLWLGSGLNEGGILVVQENGTIRNRLAGALRRRNHKVHAVPGGMAARDALLKAS